MDPMDAVELMLSGMRQIREACREIDCQPDDRYGHLLTNVERALAEYERGVADMPLDPFVYHAPTANQAGRMGRITDQARALWTTIEQEVLDCEEKREALKDLRECRMWANAGVLFGDAADAERSARGGEESSG